MTGLMLALLAALLWAWPGSAAVLGGGQPFTLDLAQQVLTDVLPAPEEGARWDLVITAPSFPLADHAQGEGVVTVDRIRVDDATDQLEASIRVALAGGETGMIAVQGRAEQRRPLPALRRSLRKGQLVSVENITESWISVRRIPADAITDSAALIGREASRLLPASRPLRAADVRSPILVHEDDPVTVTYRRLGMELAAGALADEDGALHDIIRVRNPGNGKQARGRVLGAGQVEIIAGPEVAP